MRITEPTHPLVPTAEYLSAIAHHVSSVCVITTEVGGQRFGLTATAVSSVCAEPPRLLVCVNKSGLTYEKILAIGHFGVNVLAEGQDKVAMASTA
jgi:flavin reductase (DIM6/NTAB) family NADH-FMN oxidoreductase RutF